MKKHSNFMRMPGLTGEKKQDSYSGWTEGMQ